MLSDITFIIVLSIVISIITLYSRSRTNADPIDRFATVLIGCGIVTFLLLFNLPSSTVSIQPIPRPELNSELNQIIHQQQESLSKLKQVIIGLLIVFATFFLPELYRIIRLTYRATDPETSEKKAKIAWEGKRRRGSKWFVITRGALWGLVLILVLMTWTRIETGRFFQEFDWRENVLYLLITLGLIFGIGCYFARIQWNAGEQWYEKILEKQSSEVH